MTHSYPFRTLLSQLCSTPSFPSIHSLLDLIHPPVLSLGLLPPTLTPPSSSSDPLLDEEQADRSGNGSPQLLEQLEPSLDNDPGQFWNRTLPRIQLALLNRVVVDWKPSLLETHHWQSVFCAWFGVNVHKDHTPTHIRLCFARVALETLVGRLSAPPAYHRPYHHPEIISTVLELLTSLLDQYQLTDWYEAFGNRPTASLHPSVPPETEWCRFVNTLFSIPEKVSGASSTLLGGGQDLVQQHLELQTTSFVPKIAHQFELLLAYLAASNRASYHAPRLMLLLKKFINRGFVRLSLNRQAVGVPDPDPQLLLSIWPKLVKALTDAASRKDLAGSPYSLLWRSTISRLPPGEMKTFCGCFLSLLQAHLQASNSELSTDERAIILERAGAEILKFYLTDCGDELENGTVQISDVVIELVTAHEGWSVWTARFLARWSSMLETGSSRLRAHLAKEALHKFGSKHQIAYGSTSHQVFLLVLLLTASPVGSSGSSSRTEVDICLDPRFIEALQLSLGSLRHQFRLLGMLMAELVTSTSDQALSGSSRLDFGPETWSAEDEETRLCQAIRQLIDTWRGALKLDNDLSWTEALGEAFNPDSKGMANGPRLRSTPGPKQTSHSSNHCSATNPAPIQQPVKPLEVLNLPGNSKTQTFVPRGDKPKIEVLNSGTDDGELEPYEIHSEELDLSMNHNQGIDDDAIETNLPKKKIKKPVYLSELTEYLKKQESQEHIEIALREASQLIRRKRWWGTELAERAVDICFALTNLQDNFEIPEFETLRRDGLVALVCSVPELVGPCLIEQFFLNQYSINQRFSTMNGLILGARELASGSRSQQDCNGGVDDKSFPSQRLPSTHSHHQLMERQVEPREKAMITDLSHSLANVELSAHPKGGQESAGVGKKLVRTANPQTTRVSGTLQKQRERMALQSGGLSQNTNSPGAKFKEWFLLPLLHQTWNYLNQLDRLNLSHSRTYLGGAYSFLVNEPMMMVKLLEGLQILSYLSLHSSGSNHSGVAVEVLSIGLRLRSGSARQKDHTDVLDADRVVEVGFLRLALSCLEMLMSCTSTPVGRHQSMLIRSPTSELHTIMKALVVVCEGVLDRDRFMHASASYTLNPPMQSLVLRQRGDKTIDDSHRLAVLILVKSREILTLGEP